MVYMYLEIIMPYIHEGSFLKAENLVIRILLKSLN